MPTFYPMNPDAETSSISEDYWLTGPNNMHAPLPNLRNSYLVSVALVVYPGLTDAYLETPLHSASFYFVTGNNPVSMQTGMLQTFRSSLLYLTFQSWRPFIIEGFGCVDCVQNGADIHSRTHSSRRGIGKQLRNSANLRLSLIRKNVLKATSLD